MFTRICATLFVVLMIVGASDRSEASIWTLNLGGSEYSSSGATSIASDAIVLTFNDGIVAGAVQLEVWFKGGTGVGSTAHLNDLVLNLDPTKTISSIAWVSGVKVHAKSFNPNSFGVGGSHGYDILLNYPPPTGKQRLKPGLKSTYNLFGTGLTVSSFDFLNVSGHGPFRAAAHINEVNSNKSGHYGADLPEGNLLVPEPGSLALWTIMLGAIAVNVRRRGSVV